MSEEKEQGLRPFFHRIEAKWQSHWVEKELFKAANPGEPGSEKPKFYCLDMFPYPSGDGLHVGHPLGYIATDILRRYKRMRGFNVLHPMGWDAFGLPAEQYAIQKGIHPSITTAKNIQTFKRQLQSLGNAYDWSREINTTDPKYYKWTQWIFKKLFEKGLAYQAEMTVNWCPALGTVLANDEVIDGRSERGGHPVERKPMRQWVLKITDYAEKLLSGLDALDWDSSTKELQRNWIGKSVGAKVRFPLEVQANGKNLELEVFTTRPDTLFGVTFMVIAPEHPLAEVLTTPAHKNQVATYIKEAAAKSDLQRGDLNKDKSGVFTGSYALHPLSGEKIPVWIADYVLINYGTGAIMAVPAHDERDEEFAKKFNLDILKVIDENGKLLNSNNFNGLDSKEAIEKITAHLEARGLGAKSITYKLRDWIFSRQRYWGEPIPVLHVLEGKDAGELRFLKDNELPLELPQVERYQPLGTGESPLASVADWVNTQDPLTGAKARRETNTMPGSAGSSWYYLRYMDPHNDKAFCSKEAEKYWGPVDFYIGGQEHAVGHLLYSRFWHQVLYDLGLVTHPEPFQKLFHQGMILAEDGEKMSKSRGNVVNPDDVIQQYGADTFRLFEMFLGPVEKAKPWQTANIEGVYRFLGKYYRLVLENEKLGARVVPVPQTEWPKELRLLFNKSIKQVGEDIENLRMNTAIAALMILVNEFQSYAAETNKVPLEFVRKFNLILAPFAPHMAEEIWQLLGEKESISKASWPTFDPAWIHSDEITVAVQINGKVRDQVQVSKDITEADLKNLVLARESVQKWVESKAIKKFIYVKGKLVSVVV